MTDKMLMFNLPEDKELLAGLAEVVLKHEHMSHILKMTIRSIEGITVEEALDVAGYLGPSKLREMVEKLAKNKFGKSEALLKLRGLLTRAKRLSEQRNRLTHGIWAKELDGDPTILDIKGKLDPVPSIEQLRKLSSEIDQVTDELIRERLEGYLKGALAMESL